MGTARAQEYGSVVDLLARLTVLGSLGMDISVTVPSLPGPGATVLGGAAAFAPGGKGGNQAVAAARLGIAANMSVRMIGCVGDDDFGRSAKAALAEEGIDVGAVRTVPGAPTGIAMVTIDQAGENLITVAPGANAEVGAPEIAAVGAVGPVNVLVVSAEIPVTAILAALAAVAAGSQAAGPGGAGGPSGPRPLTVLNLAPAPPREEAAAVLRARPDWLVVNESEAEAVLGRPVGGLAEAARAAAALVSAGARNAVVTVGSAGAAYHAEQETRPSSGTVPAFPVHARDTVGAGDAFVGALAVALAAGIPPEEAVTAASAAGAAAATRPGTQTALPRPADIRTATGYDWPLPVGE
jgi:ribokinase